ncbi:MAG TPA: hypothetical protein VF198_04680 [Vicinamibacterales bacterium]
MGLRAVLIVLVLLGPGCATTPRGPWVLDSREMRVRPTRVGEWIASYQQALAATLDVFEKDLGFPPLEVRLVFLPDEPTFEALLLEIGYPAPLARDAAADMTAIGGHRSVLLNQERVERRSWPERVGLLAHELTHVLQYELGGGTRGESDQWLREGYAEWVESRVLQSLHLGDGDGDALREARGRLRGHRPETLPPLTALGTFPEWVSRGRQGVGPLLYTQAFAAVAFLIERHGTPAVLDYFSRFAKSQDRNGNFEAAFGESREAFEAAFRQSVWGR